MNTLTISQLASISDLQRNYPALIGRIKKLAKPLFLLRRNQPEAVLVSVRAYEELIETKRRYEEELALKAIGEFERAKKEGRLLTGTKAEDLLE